MVTQNKYFDELDFYVDNISHETQGILSLEKKDLTIIITSYNSQNTIYLTLNSILHCKRNYKVILIDDFSSDNTVKIAKEFLGKLDLNIINLDYNTGCAAEPRNYAIKFVDTTYVYFMDSDDILVSEGFNKAFDLINNKKLDLIKFKSYYKSETNVFVMSCGMKIFKKENSSLFNAPFIWNGIYKLDIIKSNNLRFRKGIAEDLNFNIKFFRFVKKYKLSKEIGIIYLKDNSVISRNLSFYSVKKLLLNHIDSIDYINKHYNELFKEKYINYYILENLFLKNDLLNVLNTYTIEQKCFILELMSKVLLVDNPIDFMVDWLLKNLSYKLVVVDEKIKLVSDVSRETCYALKLEYEIELPLNPVYQKDLKIPFSFNSVNIINKDGILIKLVVKKRSVKVYNFRNCIFKHLVSVFYAYTSNNKLGRIKKLLIDMR